MNLAIIAIRVENRKPDLRWPQCIVTKCHHCSKRPAARIKMERNERMYKLIANNRKKTRILSRITAYVGAPCFIFIISTHLTSNKRLTCSGHNRNNNNNKLLYLLYLPSCVWRWQLGASCAVCLVLAWTMAMGRDYVERMRAYFSHNWAQKINKVSSKWVHSASHKLIFRHGNQSQ